MRSRSAGGAGWSGAVWTESNCAVASTLSFLPCCSYMRRLQGWVFNKPGRDNGGGGGKSSGLGWGECFLDKRSQFLISHLSSVDCGLFSCIAAVVGRGVIHLCTVRDQHKARHASIVAAVVGNEGQVVEERHGCDPGVRAFNPISACLRGDGNLSPFRAKGAVVRHKDERFKVKTQPIPSSLAPLRLDRPAVQLGQGHERNDQSVVGEVGVIQAANWMASACRPSECVSNTGGKCLLHSPGPAGEHFPVRRRT